MIKVSYAQTVYGKKEIDAVVSCLKSSTQMSKHASEFESKISKLFSKKYGLFVTRPSTVKQRMGHLFLLEERGSVKDRFGKAVPR